MKPQTSEKNVIKAIFEKREGILQATDPEEKRAERIELIYKLADKDTKRFLDALVVELCGKSLKELLKPEEQKAPFSV
jgi:hypothetical protein